MGPLAVLVSELPGLYLPPSLPSPVPPRFLSYPFLTHIYPSICLSVCRSIYVSISICLSIYLPFCVSGQPYLSMFFPCVLCSRMRSEGSRFALGVWQWGCVRRKLRLWSQLSATVNRLCEGRIRFSFCANAIGAVSKVSQMDSWRGSSFGICFAEDCEWSVASQLSWRLQRGCMRERSVAPQLYWHLQRRCLCDGSVPRHFYWRLQRGCLCVICVAAVILVLAQEVSV